MTTKARKRTRVRKLHKKQRKCQIRLERWILSEIRKLKNGKVPGLNNIPKELLKYGGKVLTDQLTDCTTKY